jgi:hypothetical protein
LEATALDLPEELKTEAGMHKLLLGPLSLWAEILGALVPGTVFLIFMVAKGNVLARSFLASPMLGYKSKIAAGLLIAYVIGKVTQTFGWLLLPNRNQMESFFENSDPSVPNALLKHTAVQVFIAGAIMGLFRNFDVRETFVVYMTDAMFRVSTGLLLVIASGVPGDGSLVRVGELLAGLLFLGTGISVIRKATRTALFLLGAAVGTGVSNMSSTLIKKDGFRLLQVILNELTKEEPATPESSGVGTTADQKVAPVPSNTPQARASGQ